MPRRRQETSSSSEESSEEEVDLEAQRLEIQQQEMTKMLSRMESLAKTKVDTLDHKTEEALRKFITRMEAFDRELDENKKERKKHETDIRNLRQENEKLKTDHEREVADLKAGNDKELKELNDFHERRYQHLEGMLQQERERTARAQNREQERARQKAAAQE